jgi:selenocysteine lyase/cysteine desulfurase
MLDPGLIYMNAGGLGPSPHCVIDTITRHMMELERVSETGHALTHEVRDKACALLNCDKEELAITRNATEGMNAAARGLTFKQGDEVLLTTHEHPGGTMPWLNLAKDEGIIVKTFEPGAGGQDTLDRLSSNLTPRTRAVSVSHVTCTHGLVLPVKEISALCRERGIISVIDGAQAVGMIPVDLHDLGCDFYATSGHKWLLGPKGTGLLYVRRGMLDRWHSIFAGAYSDKKSDLLQGLFERLPEARSVEYGTRNTPIIMGLGAAIDFIEAIRIDRIARYIRGLSLRLRSRLEGMQRIEVLTPSAPAASGAMLSFRVKHSDKSPWQWVDALKTEYRIRVRPVGEINLNAIRVSTHVFNGPDQVDRLVEALTHLLEKET